MKKKLHLRKEGIIIGGMLVVIGLLIGLAVPYSRDAGPWVVYQWGIVNILSGVISLLVDCQRKKLE
jgi:hypothetical protein